jgi:hypothetical protein
MGSPNRYLHSDDGAARDELNTPVKFSPDQGATLQLITYAARDYDKTLHDLLLQPMMTRRLPSSKAAIKNSM